MNLKQPISKIDAFTQFYYYLEYKLSRQEKSQSLVVYNIEITTSRGKLDLGGIAICKINDTLTEVSIYPAPKKFVFKEMLYWYDFPDGNIHPLFPSIYLQAKKVTEIRRSKSLTQDKSLQDDYIKEVDKLVELTYPFKMFVLQKFQENFFMKLQEFSNGEQSNDKSEMKEELGTIQETPTRIEGEQFIKNIRWDRIDPIALAIYMKEHAPINERPRTWVDAASRCGTTTITIATRRDDPSVQNMLNALIKDPSLVTRKKQEILCRKQKKQNNPLNNT